MSAEAQKPLKVFCSYSRKDENHLNDLRDWLRPLERQGLIEWWHDREISPGWEWEEEIDKHLRIADLILFLVSPAFMASDYVNENEINKAIERHKRGEVRVIPIIVRPTHWKWALLGKLQALPEDAKPITRWDDRDDAWFDVVEGLQKAVEDLMHERQERAAKARYRKAVEEAWTDDTLDDAEERRLVALASDLGLSTDSATDIERDIMGATKEAILERQEQVAREKERKERLEGLYDRARRLHQNEEWQAVDDVFEQIKSEDPVYPDPEGLLESTREALEAQELERRLATTYDQGWQHMDAEEWSEAAHCFEEVRRFEPGYLESERLLTLAQHLRERAAKEQYLRTVEEAWRDNKLSNAKAKRLGTLAGNLGLSSETATEIERVVIGDTKETILKRQEQVARKEKYRKRRLATESIRATDAAREKAEELGIDLSRVKGTGKDGYVNLHDVLSTASRNARYAARQKEEPNATEMARQKAQELGVDLSQLKGSGTSGRITVKDVQSAANQQ